jgi:hypothetical protein
MGLDDLLAKLRERAANDLDVRFMHDLHTLVSELTQTLPDDQRATLGFPLKLGDPAFVNADEALAASAVAFTSAADAIAERDARGTYDEYITMLSLLADVAFHLTRFFHIPIGGLQLIFDAARMTGVMLSIMQLEPRDLVWLVDAKYRPFIAGASNEAINTSITYALLRHYPMRVGITKIAQN